MQGRSTLEPAFGPAIVTGVALHRLMLLPITLCKSDFARHTTASTIGAESIPLRLQLLGVEYPAENLSTWPLLLKIPR